jgi:hypothetical protein
MLMSRFYRLDEFYGLSLDKDLLILMILWQNIINKVVPGWLFKQKMKELMSSIGKEGLQKWEINDFKISETHSNSNQILFLAL